MPNNKYSYRNNKEIFREMPLERSISKRFLEMLYVRLWARALSLLSTLESQLYYFDETLTLSDTISFLVKYMGIYIFDMYLYIFLNIKNPQQILAITIYWPHSSMFK